MQIRSEVTAQLMRQLERSGAPISARELLERAVASRPDLRFDIGVIYDMLARCERDAIVAMSWRARLRTKGVKGPRNEQVYRVADDGGRRNLLAALADYAQRTTARAGGPLPGRAATTGGR